MKFKIIQDLLDEGIVITKVSKHDDTHYTIRGNLPSRILIAKGLLPRDEFYFYGESMRECKDKLLKHANKYWDV